MEAAVAAAVLAAALLHSAWHALVKSSGDRIVALAGMNLVSASVAVALIPFVAPPTAFAAAIIAVSVVLHAAYKIALARLYSRADLSQGYPLARGLTPVIATLLAFALLGELPGAYPLAGIALIALGVSGLVLEGRAQLPIATLGAAVIVGTSVAVYSLVDAYGVRVNGDWLGYTVWLVACDSTVFVAYALATRPATLSAWRQGWERVLVSGLLGVTSFGIFMWALGRAQVGAVTALRETSVVFAALLGTLVLKERMTPVRLFAVVTVAAGACIISALR